MKNQNNEDRIQKRMKELLENPIRKYRVKPEARASFVENLQNIGREHSLITNIRMVFQPMPVRAVTLAGVLACLAFVIHTLFISQYPQATGMKGTVKIFRSSSNEWVFAKADTVRLYKDDILKTFDNGQADIVLANRYHMRIRNNSEIMLVSNPASLNNKSIKYRLIKGKCYANYRKKPSGRHFIINTREADISVLGTNFSVATMPQMNQTWIGVLSGLVRVTGITGRKKEKPLNTSVLVRPGEKTTVRYGEYPSKPVRLMENELIDMEELYRIGSKPQVALLISNGRSRTRELLNVASLYISADNQNPITANLEGILKDLDRTIKDGRRKEYLKNISSFEHIVNENPNPEYDVQFLLFIGAYYNLLGEHDKAIGTFSKVVNEHSYSSLTSIAQCAIAIIYEDELHAYIKAHEAYRKVLQKYPSSLEIYEASDGMKRLKAIQ